MGIRHLAAVLATAAVAVAGCGSSSSSSSGSSEAAFTCDWAGTDGPGGCPSQQCHCADGTVPAFTESLAVGGKCQDIDCTQACSSHGGSGTTEAVPNIFDEPACHTLCHKLKDAGAKDSFAKFNVQDACQVHRVTCSGGATIAGDPAAQRTYAQCLAANAQATADSFRADGCQSPSFGGACKDAGP